eukprot:IDg7898t1
MVTVTAPAADPLTVTLLDPAATQAVQVQEAAVEAAAPTGKAVSASASALARVLVKVEVTEKRQAPGAVAVAVLVSHSLARKLLCSGLRDVRE